MAASGSWMEQGPTTTSRRSSRPWMMSWAALRAAVTAAVARSVRGRAAMISSGGVSGLMVLMRSSSVAAGVGMAELREGVRRPTKKPPVGGG